jgi:hypothetical protein
MYEMVQNNNDFFVSGWVSCTNLSKIKPSSLFNYSTSGSKSYGTSKLVDPYMYQVVHATKHIYKNITLYQDNDSFDF